MRLIFTLCLLCLFPSAVAAQIVAEPFGLVGALVTNRDALFPASPAFNVGMDVRIGIPAEGYQVPIAPFFGVEGTLVLIEDAHEVMTSLRGGFRLDSPGYPRVFGLIGQAWPAPAAPEAPDESSSVMSQTVYGAGLRLRFGRVTLEGRYLYDRRWDTGLRTAGAFFVGSTF